MAAIVAVVPLIFYPNSLGLGLKLSPFLFLLLELVYYWAVFAVFLKGVEFANIFISGSICFFSRLGVGVIFAILVMGMHGTGFKEAFAAGIYRFMPAMVLQVISFPFILLPILKILMPPKSEKKARLVMQPSLKAEEKPAKPPAADMTDRKIIGYKAAVADKPFTGFDEALKYVGELAAVRFVLLIDHQGLPLSFYGDNLSLRNLWSAIGVYLVDKINEPLMRAGNFNLEGFELTLDLYRMHVVRVDNLYLLVAAEKSSGDSEKVRVAQAAVMVRKIYQERYSIKPENTAREEIYVPGFS
jgi:hypothetical protein